MGPDGSIPNRFLLSDTHLTISHSSPQQRRLASVAAPALTHELQVIHRPMYSFLRSAFHYWPIGMTISRPFFYFIIMLKYSRYEF